MLFAWALLGKTVGSVLCQLGTKFLATTMGLSCTLLWVGAYALMAS
jgi:hypothetical protein